MFKIGLKVWSCNPLAHQQAAIKLAEQQIFDFLEVYTVPGTLEYINRWRDVPVPKVIHAPHLAHNFNLADADWRESNQEKFAEVQRYADELSAEIIVCHGGTGGPASEAVFQIRELNDPRIILENKPFWQHPEQISKPGLDRHCVGAAFEEFSAMIEALKIPVCHDLTHTVCMANTLKLNPWTEILKFNSFDVKLHHLSDLTSADDELDSHTGLGVGGMDWERALSLIDQESSITLETPKSSNENLDDFVREVELIRNFEKNF